MTATGRGATGLALAAALAADWALGDPPDRWHPVAWFGKVMTAAETLSWRDSRVAGTAHAAAGVALAAGVAAGLARSSRRLAGTAAPVAAVLTAVALGGRSLDRAAAAVGDALEAGDLERARRLLPSLVGRDPAGLDTGEVARAVIESVAENTVDAVVAPLVWAAALGAPGVAAYRAVNTLDAMIGHRSPRYRRFGWAAARADDAANLVPARLTALAVAALRPRRARAVWTAVRADAPAHPSPNAGVAEAAFAAALGIRLGGVNLYGDRVEDRGRLGEGRAPTAGDIAAARRLARQVSAAAAVTALFPSAFLRRPEESPRDR